MMNLSLFSRSAQEFNRMKGGGIMRRFNTTAVCIPSKHYMVDLTDTVREIRKLIDAGAYFTINRAINVLDVMLDVIIAICSKIY